MNSYTSQDSLDEVHVLSVLSSAASPFPVQQRCVYIGCRECVGLVEERNHTQKNSPVWVRGCGL